MCGSSDYFVKSVLCNLSPQKDSFIALYKWMVSLQFFNMKDCQMSYLFIALIVLQQDNTIHPSLLYHTPWIYFEKSLSNQKLPLLYAGCLCLEVYVLSSLPLTPRRTHAHTHTHFRSHLPSFITHARRVTKQSASFKMITKLDRWAKCIHLFISCICLSIWHIFLQITDVHY